MIKHADTSEKAEEVHRILSQPLRAEDAPPRVMNESLHKIGFVPSWWVDDEDASRSSMNAAREMR